MSKSKKRLSPFESLLLVIWALPGVGISTLVILARSRKTAAKTATNERGRYG